MSDSTHRIALPAVPSFRVWTDVRLGAPDERASLVIDGIAAVRIAGDASDGWLVAATAECGDAPEEPRGRVAYRLRPDVAAWGLADAAGAAVAAELAAIPGWRDRAIRLAIDVTPRAVRGWVDGRLVAAWDREPGDVPRAATVDLAAAGRYDDGGALAFPGDAFLPLDLSSYGNDASTVRPIVATRIDVPAMRVVASGGVPFLAGATPGELDAIDVGRTRYRGRMPYTHASTLSSDPARALFRVPKQQYDRAHLLVSLSKEPGTIPWLAVRFIWPERGHSVVSEFRVPDDAAPDPASGLIRVAVPLDPCAFQDFLASADEDAVEIDIASRIARDGNLYPAPAGPPSAVRIHAITLETPPVAMTVTSGKIGHVFEAPGQPRMIVNLASNRDEPVRARIRVEVTGPYGGKTVETREVDLGPREAKSEPVDLPQALYGKFAFAATLLPDDEARPLVRRTSFAYLPPDTREAMDESPFGVWCFFEGHHGAPPEVAGPLFRLAGARWTLANFFAKGDPETNASRLAAITPHKVRISAANVACIANSCNAGGADVDRMIERMRQMPPALYWLVFWETMLSGTHAREFSPELVGGTPRALTDEERAVWENCRRTALDYATRVRAEFPGTTLVYGNGFPQFIAEMMRQKFPAELIDGFGLDFDMFVARPESQPGFLYAPFAGIHHLKRLQEIHGYADKPRYLTEAIYSSQADGWNTEREHADIYVRTHLLALAAGVVHFGMTTELWDPGSDFFYSHYGPVGLCHRAPELNPREAFPAYATMTRLLDRATFDAMPSTGTPSVFALRFRRAKGGPVHALWTTRGVRPVAFRGRRTGTDAVRATDLFGNARPVPHAGDRYELVLDGSPLYVEGLDAMEAIVPGEPRHRRGPENTVSVARPADGWREVHGRDAWRESLSPGLIAAATARGTFAVERASGPGGPSLRVRLASGPEGDPYAVSYTVLRPAAPIPIAGKPRALGINVRGNSGWGRIMYELVDAAGMRWRSIYEVRPVDFDGWRYCETALPHAPEGETAEGFGTSMWAPETAGARPVWPMALAGIVVEARTHVIRGGDLEPVSDRAIDLGPIVVADALVDPEIRLH